MGSNSTPNTPGRSPLVRVRVIGGDGGSALDDSLPVLAAYQMDGKVWLTVGRSSGTRVQLGIPFEVLQEPPSAEATNLAELNQAAEARVYARLEL